MRLSALILAGAVVSAATPAFGQAFNIDYRGDNGKPANTYGAASGQTGFWNSVPSTASFELRGLGGALSGVYISATGGMAHFVNDPMTTVLGDEKLMDDDLQIGMAPSTFLVSQIAVGTYWVYSYAWGPIAPSHLSDVSVFDTTGAFCGRGTCGGPWDPALGISNPGITYVCHQVTVTELVAGSGEGDFTIRIANAGGLFSKGHMNGLQITPVGLGPGPTVEVNPDG